MTVISSDIHWHFDNEQMLDKFKMTEWMESNSSDKEKLYEFLKFRMSILEEEFKETMAAFKENDPEELIDGLVDLCVIAIGTMNLFEVNPNRAWKEVHRANMEKSPGVKPSRPNPLGLPDLVKNKNWQGPDHSLNHGLLSFIFDTK